MEGFLILGFLVFGKIKIVMCKEGTNQSNGSISQWKSRHERLLDQAKKIDPVFTGSIQID
jgi:hypothetical protein